MVGKEFVEKYYPTEIERETKLAELFFEQDILKEEIHDRLQKTMKNIELIQELLKERSNHNPPSYKRS